MKKFIAILLAFTLLLLTSCGNSSVTTEQTTETSGETFSATPVVPLFNTIDGLLAAARGEGEPDNMNSLGSFEFPDYDKVIYPVCNLEEFHLVNVKLWHWGYQYWFTTEDELTDITVNVYMATDAEMSTVGEPLENGAYRNDRYVYVPYGDTFYSIYFPSSFTAAQRTPDVVTMVSVDIP